VSEAQIDQYDIMQSLVARGYQEVITYSFIAEKYHNLVNANANKIMSFCKAGCSPSVKVTATYICVTDDNAYQLGGEIISVLASKVEYRGLHLRYTNNHSLEKNDF
jgi:hypothetical protein